MAHFCCLRHNVWLEFQSHKVIDFHFQRDFWLVQIGSETILIKTSVRIEESRLTPLVVKLATASATKRNNNQMNQNETAVTTNAREMRMKWFWVLE